MKAPPAPTSINADTISVARDVINIEINGLRALLDTLNDRFVQAVDELSTVKGRIIVTGMGKSGHVARKIAATFASTGAPAHFVHPSEASHGDLGMISRDDIVLALSKSGETSELHDILAYAARFSIPTISITTAAESTLAQSSRITLLLPNTKEACGETKAPTTSTTMMMALGDALAVALLRRRGFTAEDFVGFHPGGNLGAALRRVRDLMHGGAELPLCGEDTGISDAIAVMTKYGFGCVGVVDANGSLCGIITDGDLRRHLSDTLSQKRAADVMTTDPRVTDADALAGDVLAMMSKGKITALFVVADRKPIGLIHVHDCLSIGVL